MKKKKRGIKDLFHEREFITGHLNEPTAPISDGKVIGREGRFSSSSLNRS